MKIFALSVMFLLASCADPNAAKKQMLLSEIQQIQSNYSLLSQNVLARQQKIAFLSQKLTEQRTELAEYESRVKAYLLNHKMAVAALALGLGGTAVAYDPNNEFSDDAQQIAGIGAILAGLYAINNFSEVAEVADQIAQADSHVKSLTSQIAASEKQISIESEPLAQQQQSLALFQQQYDQRNSELARLR